jgi:hypothetical protein
MNTANVKNVRSLFERVGLDPFTGVPDADLEKLEQLVKERGEIVHTGRALRTSTRKTQWAGERLLTSSQRW